MVVNRANSGVAVADMERTVGMPALALIRSGGLLFVRAANEGRTVDRDVPEGTDHRATSTTSPTRCSASRRRRRRPTKPGLRIFARQKEAVRSRRDAWARPADQSAPIASAWSAARRQPGQRLARSPVRLSTCSTPRR